MSDGASGRRRWARASVLVVLAGGALVAVPTPAGATAGTTYVVTSSSDPGDGVCDADCTIREALTAANAAPDVDTITFSLPGPSPASIILPHGLLVQQPVVIDGGTVPGCGGVPGVTVGNGGGPTEIGFNVYGGGATIRGLRIAGFADGIILQQQPGNAVECSTLYNNSTAGIWVASSANNVIGGAGRGNTIYNSGDNVLIQYPTSTGNRVEGNLIGTDGSFPGGGNPGVEIASTAGVGNVVGGSASGTGNVLSGNTGPGVRLEASGTTVEGNLIGTNPTGNTDLGNGDGVVVVGAVSSVSIRNNVISGNDNSGITVTGTHAAVTDVTIRGNRIGTNAAGTAVLANTNDGILVNDTSGVTIGGPAGSDGNLIGGNRFGIWVVNSGATGISVQGNAIGTDLAGTADLHNRRDGVFIQNAAGNTVGGRAPGQGNVIGRNTGAGVGVYGGTGDEVVGNALSGNGGLGIDLDEDGVTSNDALDADTGANLLQNFPVLTAVSADATSTTVNGTLSSAAGSSYTVDVYASPACDPSSHGEGARYLGSTVVTTDGNGDGAIGVTFPSGSSPGDVVTATATDTAGNTSELSTCAVVPGAEPSISSVSPSSASTCSSCSVTVTLTGSNFAPDAVASADSTALSTSWTSSTQLTATIPASLLGSAATLQLSVTNVGAAATSTPVPFFVTETSATVSASDTATSTDPSGSAVASTGDVTATASGAGTVSVAQYSGNPVGTTPPPGTSSFFDVNVADGSFTSVTVVDCNLDPNNTSHLVYWYDGTQWLPVADQSFDGTCVTLTLSSTTSPSVTDLVGTPFAEGSGTARTISVGPASTEGTLRISAGDWLSAGYHLRLTAKSKKAVSVSVTSARLLLPVVCGNRSTATLVVPLRARTFSIPAGSTAWFDTNDPDSPAGFLGAVQVTDPCAGTGIKTSSAGATLIASVTTSPGGTALSVGLHYRDPRAKGKRNISCASTTSNPEPGVADCTASWSTPATV